MVQLSPAQVGCRFSLITNTIDRLILQAVILIVITQQKISQYKLGWKLRWVRSRPLLCFDRLGWARYQAAATLFHYWFILVIYSILLLLISSTGIRRKCRQHSDAPTKGVQLVTLLRCDGCRFICC